MTTFGVRSRYLGVKETLQQLLDYDTIRSSTKTHGQCSRNQVRRQQTHLSANGRQSHGSAIPRDSFHRAGLLDMQGTKRSFCRRKNLRRDRGMGRRYHQRNCRWRPMVSKITAAKLATKAGCGVFIASGSGTRRSSPMIAGGGPGTFFVPTDFPWSRRNAGSPTSSVQPEPFTSTTRRPRLARSRSQPARRGHHACQRRFAAGDVVI